MIPPKICLQVTMWKANAGPVVPCTAGPMVWWCSYGACGLAHNEIKYYPLARQCSELEIKMLRRSSLGAACCSGVFGGHVGSARQGGGLLELQMTGAHEACRPGACSGARKATRPKACSGACRARGLPRCTQGMQVEGLLRGTRRLGGCSPRRALNNDN